jgi:regulator of RNase E activity RraA
MYHEWSPIYTALAADIMDAMGYREQSLDHTVRPSMASTNFCGPAVTLDAYQT